jgi:hypothetical protein
MRTEAVEHVHAAAGVDLEALVVVVAAHLAASHLGPPGVL